MSDHPRESWMLRRKADWTLLCTIIGMAGTIVFYAVKIVRAHSQWMDRVVAIEKLEPEITADHQAIQTMDAKLDVIIAGLGLRYREKK